MIDFTQEEKDFFMSEALKEAQKSLDKAEIPIGCVIVKDGEIVGRGHNAREELNQAIMHAEVMAIQEANRTIGNWRLLDCTLFVTIEPCVMCSGAIVWLVFLKLSMERVIKNLVERGAFTIF